MKIFDSTFTNHVRSFLYFAKGSELFVDSDRTVPLYMEELEKSMICPVYVQRTSSVYTLETRVTSFVKTADAIQITAGSNTYYVYPRVTSGSDPVIEEDIPIIEGDVPDITPVGG